jgi:hypothetical protein
MGISSGFNVNATPQTSHNDYSASLDSPYLELRLFGLLGIHVKLMICDGIGENVSLNVKITAGLFNPINFTYNRFWGGVNYGNYKEYNQHIVGILMPIKVVASASASNAETVSINRYGIVFMNFVIIKSDWYFKD